jgi:hypothetical protein
MTTEIDRKSCYNSSIKKRPYSYFFGIFTHRLLFPFRPSALARSTWTRPAPPSLCMLSRSSPPLGPTPLWTRCDRVPDTRDQAPLRINEPQDQRLDETAWAKFFCSRNRDRMYSNTLRNFFGQQPSFFAPAPEFVTGHFSLRREYAVPPKRLQRQKSVSPLIMAFPLRFLPRCYALGYDAAPYLCCAGRALPDGAATPHLPYYLSFPGPQKVTDPPFLAFFRELQNILGPFFSAFTHPTTKGALRLCGSFPITALSGLARSGFNTLEQPHL